MEQIKQSNIFCCVGSTIVQHYKLTASITSTLLLSDMFLSSISGSIEHILAEQVRAIINLPHKYSNVKFCIERTCSSRACAVVELVNIQHSDRQWKSDIANKLRSLYSTHRLIHTLPHGVSNFFWHCSWSAEKIARFLFCAVGSSHCRLNREQTSGERKCYRTKNNVSFVMCVTLFSAKPHTPLTKLRIRP